jgi:hypothetical protein
MARSILSENQIIYGQGGIKGDRFSEVAGWEKGTVGFAGNVYSRLASENGIQPVDPAITASREPFKVGRFLVKILKNVPFFDKKINYTWRYIIEDTAVSLTGIQDPTFEPITRTHGVIRQQSAYGGIYKETNGEFTIKVPETKGQLVRKSIDYCVNGLSDFKTGVATFYGKDIPDLQPNKSMTILYVLLGPTCRPDDIEFACIWHDAIITQLKHAHNNADTLGEAGGGTDHDLVMSGIYDRGPQVDLLAALIVDREGLYEERSWNALLPKYMYDEYLNASGPNRSDYNITIAERLAHEININGAYESSTEYDQIKSAHAPSYTEVSNAEKNGMGSTPGTYQPTSARAVGDEAVLPNG